MTAVVAEGLPVVGRYRNADCEALSAVLLSCQERPLERTSPTVGVDLSRALRVDGCGCRRRPRWPPSRC